MKSKITALSMSIFFTLGSSLASADQQLSNVSTSNYKMEICVYGGWHDLTGGGEYIVKAEIQDEKIDGRFERTPIQLYQFGKKWPQEVGRFNNKSVSLALDEETCFESEFDVSRVQEIKSKLSIVVIEADGMTLAPSKHDDYIFFNKYSFSSFESDISSKGSKIIVKLKK